MSAPVNRGNSKIQAAYRGTLKVKEKIEMRLATEMTKVRARLSEALATKTPAKILGGLAFGALPMTPTFLHISTIHGDGPTSPLVEVTLCTIDYLDEFADAELGPVAAGITAGIIEYGDEFADAELGSVAARATFGSLEVKRPAGDAWNVDMPFYEDFGE